MKVIHPRLCDSYIQATESPSANRHAPAHDAGASPPARSASTATGCAHPSAVGLPGDIWRGCVPIDIWRRVRACRSAQGSADQLCFTSVIAVVVTSVLSNFANASQTDAFSGAAGGTVLFGCTGSQRADAVNIMFSVTRIDRHPC